MSRTVKMQCALSNFEHYAKITNTLFSTLKRILALFVKDLFCRVFDNRHMFMKIR